MNDAADKPPAEKGLTCRKCGCRHHYTIETRKTSGDRVRRRRVCRHCGYKFTSYERAF